VNRQGRLVRSTVNLAFFQALHAHLTEGQNQENSAA